MKQWYYAKGSEKNGPFDNEEIAAEADKGNVQPDTLVWREGMANWVPMSETFIAKLPGKTKSPPPLASRRGTRARISRHPPLKASEPGRGNNRLKVAFVVVGWILLLLGLLFFGGAVSLVGPYSGTVHLLRYLLPSGVIVTLGLIVIAWGVKDSGVSFRRSMIPLITVTVTAIIIMFLSRGLIREKVAEKVSELNVIYVNETSRLAEADMNSPEDGKIKQLATPSRAANNSPQDLAANKTVDKETYLKGLAEQGDVDAQYALGLMYGKGEEVPTNYKLAYIWTSLVVINGDGTKEFDAIFWRDEYAKMLDRQTLSHARQLVSRMQRKIDDLDNQ